MSDYQLTVRTFAMGTDKEAALKPLEEAAEVFGAWQMLDAYGETYRYRDERYVTFLADEIADTIQAACNLAARYDINLNAAMDRCEKRNRERGRYFVPPPITVRYEMTHRLRDEVKLPTSKCQEVLKEARWDYDKAIELLKCDFATQNRRAV